MPICPVCKATDRQQAHMVQPVMLGGRNAVDYYNCEYCGVMYKPVGFEGEQAKLGIKPDKNREIPDKNRELADGYEPGNLC